MSPEGVVMPAAKGPIEDIYPLTRMQQALLFRCVSYPDSPLFMGQWWALLDGVLDADKLAAAWQTVVDRHPVLRTGFNWELKDKPFQVVHRAARLSVERLDWSDPADWRARLSAFLADDRAQPFALNRPPLLRVRLIRLGPSRHLLLWTRHHLTVDGWSLGAILEEVFAVYAALRAGGTPELAPVTPYRLYVEWERAGDLAAATAHWRGALEGFEAAPADAATVSASGAPAVHEAVRVLDAAEAECLADFARRHGLTVNTMVQGAWAHVLARRTNRDDVLFGAVETVRPPHLLAGGSAPIGMQIAVMPVRCRIDRTPLCEWLVALQAAMAAGREAGAIGLDAVRELIGARHDTLPFDSLVGFQNYPLDEGGAFRETGLTLVESGDTTLPDMPLNLMVELGDGLTLRLMADRRRHAEGELQAILEMLAHALASIPDSADLPAASLDPVPPARRRAVLEQYCAGPPLTDCGPSVPDAILACAVATPDAVALRQGEQSLTYAALRALAEAVAARLDAQGVPAGSRVGIMLDRTPLAIGAILGTMIHGGAYVPLDGDGAPERRDHMIASAGIAAVLTTAERARTLAGARAIAVDDLAVGSGDVAGPRTRPALDGTGEAYVVFTSGSTGRPKGVSISHDNLRWHVAARAAAYPDQPIGTFLLTFPLIFDGSVTVIFSTLSAGGTLVLPRPIEATDADRLVALIAAAGVTHTDMTPSLWDQVLLAATPPQLSSMRLALVAGESCPRALVSRHAAKLPGVPLYNEYGPTEATVWSSLDRCRPDEAEATVPIGRPIPGTFAYVVDRQDRLCPPGVRGELLLAGPTISRGYVGQDELTRERFTSNPFATDPNAATVYRTGDLASFGEDGRLRFHGRADRQVKVNGYRIELGEIEACLTAHPRVLESAVLVRDPGDGRPARLVAHVAGPDLPDGETLRHHAERNLPPWMVPPTIVAHEHLPRSPAGKVDLSALHEPAIETAVEPPQTVLERRVAAAWAKAIGATAVGRLDNFFEIGGDSLRAMQVISRLRREGAPRLELLDLFEAPRLADFALRLEGRGGEATAGPGPAMRQRARARVALPASGETEG